LQIIRENKHKVKPSPANSLASLAKSITDELSLHYDYYYPPEDSDRSLSVTVTLWFIYILHSNINQLKYLDKSPSIFISIKLHSSSSFSHKFFNYYYHSLIYLSNRSFRSSCLLFSYNKNARLSNKFTRYFYKISIILWYPSYWRSASFGL